MDEVFDEFGIWRDLPQHLKSLFVQILAAQHCIDGDLTGEELSELYEVMCNLQLDETHRQEVLRFVHERKFENILDMCKLLVSKVKPSIKEEVKYSILHNLFRTAYANSSSKSTQTVEDVANEFYDHSKQQVEDIFAQFENEAKYWETLLSGNMTNERAKEFAKTFAKTAPAAAAAVGLPIAAVYSLGTFGLSAAGMSSGLAALGVGGIAGLSSMATGIGVVAGIGILSFTAIKWATNNKNSGKKTLKQKQEEFIDEQLRLERLAVVTMANDFVSLHVWPNQK